MKYKIGMYGGSFNPLHLGHVDCIIRAANMCEQLYIVLSVGINRDEIDSRIRYRWLYQLTRHIGKVKIVILEDKANLKQDYTEEYWMNDAMIVKKPSITKSMLSFVVEIMAIKVSGMFVVLKVSYLFLKETK